MDSSSWIASSSCERVSDDSSVGPDDVKHKWLIWPHINLRDIYDPPHNEHIHTLIPDKKPSTSESVNDVESSANQDDGDGTGMAIWWWGWQCRGSDGDYGGDGDGDGDGRVLPFGLDFESSVETSDDKAKGGKFGNWLRELIFRSVYIRRHKAHTHTHTQFPYYINRTNTHTHTETIPLDASWSKVGIEDSATGTADIYPTQRPSPSIHHRHLHLHRHLHPTDLLAFMNTFLHISSSMPISPLIFFQS